MKLSKKILVLLGVLMSFALIAAACGSDGDSDETATTDEPSETTDEPAAEEPAAEEEAGCRRLPRRRQPR